MLTTLFPLQSWDALPIMFSSEQVFHSPVIIAQLPRTGKNVVYFSSHRGATGMGEEDATASGCADSQIPAGCPIPSFAEVCYVF